VTWTSVGTHDKERSSAARRDTPLVARSSSLTALNRHVASSPGRSPTAAAMEATIGPGVVLAMMLLAGAQTDPVGADTFFRIRTSELKVLASVQEGRRRSSTFAALVERVKRGTFTYIVRAHRLPHGVDGCPVHEGTDTAKQYETAAEQEVKATVGRELRVSSYADGRTDGSVSHVSVGRPTDRAIVGQCPRPRQTTV